MLTLEFYFRVTFVILVSLNNNLCTAYAYVELYMLFYNIAKCEFCINCIVLDGNLNDNFAQQILFHICEDGSFKDSGLTL